MLERNANQGLLSMSDWTVLTNEHQILSAYERQSMPLEFGNRETTCSNIVEY